MEAAPNTVTLQMTLSKAVPPSPRCKNDLLQMDSTQPATAEELAAELELRGKPSFRSIYGYRRTAML